MEISHLALGAAAVFASAIAAVSGFGIGSLLTPLLILSLPSAHAVALVAIPRAVATTIRWFSLRGDVHDRPSASSASPARRAGLRARRCSRPSAVPSSPSSSRRCS